MDGIETFSELIDFTLLHEFRHDSGHHHFDWHVDTKPGDGKGRTINVNVMLSQSGRHFTGGHLQVGNMSYMPSQGSLYIYPAGLPHKVGALASGHRYTLVLALTERRLDDGSSVAAERQRAYWAAIELAFESLTSGALEREAKLHILHGEHHEALGRGDQAQQAFCRAYQATAGDGVDYAQRFYESAMDSLQEGKRDLRLAESYLRMASCVQPEHPSASAALGVVREALSIVQKREEAPAKEEL